MHKGISAGSLHKGRETVESVRTPHRWPPQQMRQPFQASETHLVLAFQGYWIHERFEANWTRLTIVIVFLPHFLEHVLEISLIHFYFLDIALHVSLCSAQFAFGIPDYNTMASACGAPLSRPWFCTCSALYVMRLSPKSSFFRCSSSFLSFPFPFFLCFSQFFCGDDSKIST